MTVSATDAPPRASTKALTSLRPAKVNFYLRFMREQGFSSASVLEGTGLTTRILADPRYLVEVSKYIRVISNIHTLCSTPALAFTLGQHLTLGDLGILGYCVISCDNTDDATRLWHQYNPTFFGNLIDVTFETTHNRVCLTHVPAAGIREDLLQFLIEEKICYDLALQRLIGLENFPIEHLALSYRQPAHVQLYTDLIPCPIQFSAAKNTMLLADHAMALPLQGRDRETNAHCLKLLNDVFVSITSGASILHKVTSALHEDISRRPGISEIAATLNCTGRTLNRALGKDGMNFRNLSTRIRLEAIKNLLATTHFEAKQIAAQVGFSDIRSLRRFFKSETGKTIGQFRGETIAEMRRQ